MIINIFICRMVGNIRRILKGPADPAGHISAINKNYTNINILNDNKYLHLQDG